MHVRYGLTGHGAVVDADVVATRRVARVEFLLRSVYKLHHSRALIDCEIEEAADMSPRDNEGVPGRDRETVADEKPCRILRKDP